MCVSGTKEGRTVRKTLTLPALPKDLLRVIGMWRWILLGQEEDQWAEAARGAEPKYAVVKDAGDVATKAPAVAAVAVVTRARLHARLPDSNRRRLDRWPRAAALSTYFRAPAGGLRRAGR